MRLYNFDVSPFAARCRLAIYRKGLDVEIAAVPEGGPRGAAYRALNPIGKVPALELDDGTVIPESEVIVDYLEDRFPEPPLLPETPEARARVRLLSRLGGLYLMPPMGRLFGQMRAGTRDAAVVDAALVEVGTALDHLERFASPDSGDGWIAGAAFTIADCALLPHARRPPQAVAGVRPGRAAGRPPEARRLLAARAFRPYCGQGERRDGSRFPADDGAGIAAR